MKTIDFLKEEVRPWIADNAVNETIESQDGLKLNAYRYQNPEEKAMIVMTHGFCGFFGKYHELFYRFAHAGYSLYFVEVRGHGHSERSRELPDQRVYVDSFAEYVQDIHAACQRARELSGTGKLFFFGHSMGGCTGGLYLEQYPQDFVCAVLSSPMMQMDYGSIPDAAVDAMAVYSKVVKNGEEYAPGQGPWTGEYAFAKSSDDSEDRYRYQFEQRCEDPLYQTWGGTWAWATAAKDASRKVTRNAAQVITPVLLCKAGKDTMVRADGQRIFKEKSLNTAVSIYPESKHEIYNSFDAVVEKYTADLITFYDAHTRG